MILVLDRVKAGLNFLSGTSSAYGRGEIKVVYPEVALLPGSWKGYDSADLLVMGDFSLKELTLEQQRALETWVRLGGSLVVSTGANYLNYIGKHIGFAAKRQFVFAVLFTAVVERITDAALHSLARVD